MILLVLNTKDTLKLSTLPTLLLITTFFRLCTNISTTRCILTNGTAGKLINIFGEVTIQHSLLVGLTIFLIITVVQFVVIAKCGERIA